MIKNTKLTEILLFGVLLLLIATGVLYLWGSNTCIIMWMFSLTMWTYIHSKKDKALEERLDEIDQRDMDFRDEFYDKFSKLERSNE